MNKYIQLNNRYLLTKILIIILWSILIGYILSLLYSSALLEGYNYLDMYREELSIEFLKDIQIIVRFFSVILIILITILFNLDAYRNIAKYIVQSSKCKLGFMFSKITYLMIIALMINLLLLMVFLAFYRTFTPFSYDIKTIVKWFMFLLFQNIILLLVCDLLMNVINNIIIGFIPLGIFWIMEVNKDLDLISNNSFIKILYNLIPSTVEVEGFHLLIGNIIGYLIFGTCLFLSDILLYLTKDIS